MNDIVTIIQQVGFPIAAALGLGWFIYKLIMRIVDGMETKLDIVDEKVAQQISAIEERLGTKLDSQHGILVALIDRIRSLDNEIIRQDTLIKTILGVPQLIDSNKIAKADRDDQRKYYYVYQLLLMKWYINLSLHLLVGSALQHII